MAFSLDKIIRDNVKKMKPYSSARDEYKGKDGVFLDANENSFGSVITKSVHRYPDPLQWKVKHALSEVKNVPAENIFLGNGSDEPIDLILRAVCVPGKDAIITLPPTYGMYEVSANLNDVKIIEVPLSADYNLREEAILKAVTPEVKVIFICSPNNPTGNLMNRTAIQNILTQFDGIVVVDEAYIDFASEPSFTELLNKYPNLLVMQTFSKAWGLAALRLGIAYASTELIQVLNKIKPPYNINQMTQELALEAIQNVDFKNELVAQILEQRTWLEKELKQLPCIKHIVPSDANFILVKTQDGTDMYNYLVSNQVITRNRSSVLLCEGGVRITVGTPPENQLLIDLLKKYKKAELV
ncbi:MAG: histidinol-phosphate transaminase [Cytophagaceae bacterium]